MIKQLLNRIESPQSHGLEQECRLMLYIFTMQEGWHENSDVFNPHISSLAWMGIVDEATADTLMTDEFDIFPVGQSEATFEDAGCCDVVYISKPHYDIELGCDVWMCCYEV